MKALISVSDKTNIVSFAKGLVALGYDIISTGGTYKVLKENGIEAIPIDEVTQFPEMLDGRVKTLHPNIHGGLLSLRHNKEHMDTVKAHNIDLIDLVVVNLYPFEKTIQKESTTLEEAIENIDIGGPSMIRSGAKNVESVGVIVNPDRYADILDELKANGGTLTQATRNQLMCEAFEHTARYDAIIAGYLAKKLLKGNEESFPDTLAPVLNKVMDLRYGENPHQKAAFYKMSNEKGLPGSEQLNGKELSYNNIIDMEAAWAIAKEFELPAAAIIKHTNPCGAAVGDSIFEAYKKAYESDPISAFGGIIGLNRTVDKATAEEISNIFVEAVIAPDYEEDALKILKEKANLRVLKMSPYDQQGEGLSYRYVQGGFLVQTTDTKLVEKNELKVVTNVAPTTKQLNDLLFANQLVKHVKSNAILIAKDGQVLGVGAGQMSRVEAMEIAIKKAGDKVKGAVVASDAFFPFKDSVQQAQRAGIAAIIQPGGSKKDQDSIECCNEHGISMLFSGYRHFKH